MSGHIKPKIHLVIREAKYMDAMPLCGLIRRNIEQKHSGHYTPKQIGIWQNGYTDIEIRKQINERKVYVLECNNMLCGTIQFDPLHQEVKGFYLEPDCSNIGLGNVLFGFIISYLKASSYKCVELTSNKWTVPFYQKQNFRILRKEIVEWDNHPFEEWRMRRTFI